MSKGGIMVTIFFFGAAFLNQKDCDFDAVHLGRTRFLTSICHTAQYQFTQQTTSFEHKSTESTASDIKIHGLPCQRTNTLLVSFLWQP
jgi:hypothetical protein